MKRNKTNFNVSLDLDVVLDDDGLQPEVVVRNIVISERRVEEHHYENEELEDEEKDE